MSTKTAIIASIVVFVVIGVLGCGGGVWYISQNPIPGVRTQDRMGMLGSGLGMATVIPLFVIWILWAAKWRRDRDEREAEEHRQRKRAKRKARRDEERHTARLNKCFEDCDVLLTPQTAKPPVNATEWEGRSALSTVIRMAMTYPYTAAWNLTGQPAAAVPAGLTKDGLPVAVSLIGKPADEATLLSLSAQLEAERPWTDRRPPVS